MEKKIFFFFSFTNLQVANLKISFLKINAKIMINNYLFNLILNAIKLKETLHVFNAQKMDYAIIRIM
jgi:hypothetical protein